MFHHMAATPWCCPYLGGAWLPATGRRFCWIYFCCPINAPRWNFAHQKTSLRRENIYRAVRVHRTARPGRWGEKCLAQPPDKKAFWRWSFAGGGGVNGKQNSRGSGIEVLRAVTVKQAGGAAVGGGKKGATNGSAINCRIKTTFNNNSQK